MGKLPWLFPPHLRELNPLLGAEPRARDHASLQGRGGRGVSSAGARWYLSIPVSHPGSLSNRALTDLWSRRTWGQPHFRKRHLTREGWTIQVEELGGESSFSYFLYILRRTETVA